MIINLYNFIKTGEFGPVKIGMLKNEVLKLLGSPDSENNIGENGCILLYGWYELFTNHENRLYSIQNDNYNPEQPETYKFKNELVEVNPCFLNEAKNQTIHSVSELLNIENIKYEITDYYGHKAIKTNSGVIIDFSEEQNELGINAHRSPHFMSKFCYFRRIFKEYSL
jgi:hypothetical protein